MACQSGDNPVPIPSQSCSNLVSICFHFTLQCGYNPSPIYCLVNPWPIRYDGYSVPIRFQSEVNPRLHIIHQSISNHIPIYELNANLPIQCQSNHPWPIQCQSLVNLPIRLSNANPVPICQSIINLPIYHKSANPSPNQESNANPGQICKSITNPCHSANPPIVSQSRVNHTVQCQSSPSTIHQNNTWPIHQCFANQPVHDQTTRLIKHASV